MGDTYVAGVCNIGRAEIDQRRRLGYSTIVLGLMMVGAGTVLNWPAWIAFLVSGGFAGAAAMLLLQAYRGFCAFFALRGVFNVTDRLRRTTKIHNDEQRRADLRSAYGMIAVSAAVGVAGGVAGAGLAWLV